MNGNQLSQAPLGINENRIAYRPAALQRLPRRISATAAVVLMIGTLSPAAQAANADDTSAGPSAGVIAADLLVVRPAGAVLSLFGAVLFIPTALLASTGGWGNVMDAYELLIREPFNTTFRRPLGST
jgi:hypothetical protein